MKRIFLISAVLLALPATLALSQTEQRAWEFSISGAFSSLTSKAEVSGGGASGTYESETANIFSIMLRPGFFVIDGLEIEPEICWGGASGEAPSLSFSGNLSYNLLIPGTAVVPFVLAGYGIGNGIPVLGEVITRSSDAFDISVLNLGGGLKVFVTKAVAFRAEYRYQRFAQETTMGYASYNYTTNLTNNFHKVLLGVSLFLQ